MKQITKTDSIRDRLRRSLGATADVEGLRVYEAIALNTLPLRKTHPLYNGARAERSLLLEMAAALEAESLPIQIQHDTSPLPVGRVFHGEVVERGAESELRVLFFLDPTAKAEGDKIDAGTVDQVSVSILPKQIICSASGFDFLSDKATFEQRWLATDPDGNTLGKKGVYGKLVGLDKWMELSLVGMGGARNARIVNREQSHFGASFDRLAASGMNPSVFVLDASIGSEDMDLPALIASLTEKGVELHTKNAEVATLTASLATVTAERDQLKLSAAAPSEALTAAQTQVAELTTDRDTLKASNDAALAALKEVATRVLTASGKQDQTLPETAAELTAIINDTSTGLVAALAAGGRAKDPITDVKAKAHTGLGGFRTPRR